MLRKSIPPWSVTCCFSTSFSKGRWRLRCASDVVEGDRTVSVARRADQSKGIDDTMVQWIHLSRLPHLRYLQTETMSPERIDAMTIIKAAAVQISPVLYSREGTVDKVVQKIIELGRQGVQFATFPETVVPYYPYFSFVQRPFEMGAGTPQAA